MIEDAYECATPVAQLACKDRNWSVRVQDGLQLPMAAALLQGGTALAAAGMGGVPTDEGTRTDEGGLKIRLQRVLRSSSSH